MKTYKRIMAEGLVLAGLLGMFGCHKTEKTEYTSLEYKIENAVVTDKISKIEDHLEKQGFRLVKKDNTKWYNMGEAWYEKDDTRIILVRNYKGEDSTKVELIIRNSEKDFKPSDLEKEIYKIIVEETKWKHTRK